jgi:hypothetical protein
MQTWCVDCLRLSPKTESLYDLGTEGWRAVGGIAGSYFEWRCPECWGAFKEVMGEAAVSSARFRAAAAIVPPPLEDAESHVRSSDGSTYPLDTPRESRFVLIASEVHEIFDVLAQVPVRASTRAHDLLMRARDYESIVSRWSSAPPAEEEQVELFDRVSRLHADATALVAAYHRGGR